MYTPGTAKEWKSAVMAAAKEKGEGVTFTGPLALSLSFYFARPQSHFGAKGLKPSAPVFHTKKPDADNLAKAVMDAMTDAGFWTDDCQVVESHTFKSYVTDTAPEGCRVVVTQLTE